MKRILLPFLLTFIIAGELEVEGGITATGELQSPTIEALLAQIEALEKNFQVVIHDHRGCGRSSRGDPRP